MTGRGPALLLVSLAILTCFYSSTVAQESAPAPLLKMNQPIERDMAGGEVHKYSVTVPANHFVRVNSSQQGIDLKITFSDASRKKLVDEHDHWGGVTGVETFAVVTTEACTCTVEVGTVQKTALPGRYKIEL